MRKLILAAPVALVLTACIAAKTESPMPGEGPAMATAHHGPHIISVKSNNAFDRTLTQLQSAVERRGFKTFGVIDHAKGAASIGANLRPTTLIIFGNPKGGTPLIQAEQRLGLRLPLKMLVYEDARGGVHVAYLDMAHLFHEYGVSGIAAPRANIENALASIAMEAASG